MTVVFALCRYYVYFTNILLRQTLIILKQISKKRQDFIFTSLIKMLYFFIFLRQISHMINQTFRYYYLCR